MYIEKWINVLISDEEYIGNIVGAVSSGPGMT